MTVESFLLLLAVVAVWLLALCAGDWFMANTAVGQRLAARLLDWIER